MCMFAYDALQFVEQMSTYANFVSILKIYYENDNGGKM